MINSGKRRKFLTVAATTLASFAGTQQLFGKSTVDLSSNLKGEEINVKHFGAKGDGKTDDTAAIQKAVATTGNRLFFPKGHYKISKTILIDLAKMGYASIRGNGDAQVIMAGAGPAFKISGTHFGSADPERFDKKVWSSERMPVVEGLSIEGQHQAAVGIEAIGTMQLTITRVQVRQTLHAIHLRENNRNLIIADCHLYENHGIGVFYDGVNLHQSNITGSHISYNKEGGIVTKGGNIRNIHITGCDIESNMGSDKAPTANVLIDCSGSAVGTAEVAITGCTIQHNRNAPNSANIRIIGKDQSGIGSEKERWGNVTITGNVLSDVMVNIDLQYCRGVVVTGNTIWQGYDYGLLMEGCSNVVFGSNLFDANANYPSGTLPSNKLLVTNSEDCTFTGVQVYGSKDSPGLVVRDSKRINIGNCSLLSCEKVGLLLDNVTDSKVSGCMITALNPNDYSFEPIQSIGGHGNKITD
ncbi:right-handed parallel beta-helix repeat-containing protein [Cyclobacterium marinum]|uniref:right-handed parallel beta-helix repeat-containing protein n=1 Tax=Cyclobacterium marinum TaxID=104 RepID=UPI0030D767EB|tara:strand:+ start:3398 stop:4807 length:1410 start_codon:yes stop_codon:yes gene_type:complete